MKKLSVAVGFAFLFDHVLDWLTRLLIDGPMILILLKTKSAVLCYVIMVPVNILFSGIIFRAYTALVERGKDPMCFSQLFEIRDTKGPLPRKESLVRWILSRRAAIFLIGSHFVLDPSMVTVLLKKRGMSNLEAFIKITIPSVLYCMVLWTALYWSIFVLGIEWLDKVW